MDRYTELKTKLLQANDSYYNKNTSILSDEEYDKLRDEFINSYPDDPFIKTIGAKVPANSKWEKEKHKIPMSSLNKVNNIEEFEEWNRKILDKLKNVDEVSKWVDEIIK